MNMQCYRAKSIKVTDGLKVADQSVDAKIMRLSCNIP